MADQILLRLHHALRAKPSPTIDEEELIVIFENLWDKMHDKGLRKGRQEGRQEGRIQGRLEAQANALLTVLRARGIRVPPAERARICAEQDLERLGRWLERAVVESTLAAVLDAPVRRRVGAVTAVPAQPVAGRGRTRATRPRAAAARSRAGRSRRRA